MQRCVLLMLLLPLCVLSGFAADSEVLKLDEAFVKDTLALSPTSATAVGYHEHQGVSLDEQLDDNSPSGNQAAIKTNRQYLQKLARFLKPGLSAEDRADLEIIRLQCEASLLELQDIQSYRHNPTNYVEMIGNAIYQPLTQNYAPEHKRMEQITARVEKIPAALETAKRNLISAPKIWITVAQQEAQGDKDLIDKQVRNKIPADLRSRYDLSAAAALKVLTSFDQFLKEELSKHESDWRLGTNLYNEKFKLTLDTGDTPAQILKEAEAQLQSVRQQMKKDASGLYAKYYPGETAPADTNRLIAKVLAKVALQHTTPDAYFGDAKQALGTATEFVRTKNLVPLPPIDNLQVIPTPEFMRGIYSVGGFASAPPLEPQLGAFYWITPFTADMSRERVESKLREYNRWGLELLTIHEAMPGHYVQFQYASRVQPKWRGVLREVYSNGPYVEGWAVYATQILIENGFDPAPEMRLTWGKHLLRVIANTILDIRLQTLNMTDDQALALMTSETFQEKEEAVEKLQRAKLSSCQLPTYFAGWRGWNRLHARIEAAQGGRFQESSFRRSALEQGAVPLPILETLELETARNVH